MTSTFRTRVHAAAVLAVSLPVFLSCGARDQAEPHQTVATAQSGGGMCMVERFNLTKPADETSLNCTANDVRIAQFINLSPDVTSCVEGEPVTVQLRAEIVATSTERWDVGLFVAKDGKEPNILRGEPGGSEDVTTTSSIPSR